MVQASFEQTRQTPPQKPRDTRQSIASSFSRSLPEIWKPAKSGIHRWINDLPGPRTREEPFDPSSVVGHKHELDCENEKLPCTDTHREKRVRRYSSVSDRHNDGFVMMRRRERLLDTSQRMIRKIANAFDQRFFHGTGSINDSDSDSDDYHQQQHQHHQEKDIGSSNSRPCSTVGGTTIRNSMVSNSPPGTPLKNPDRARMRFAIVGDSGCGKSSLLLRYYRDTFTEGYVPTQYELFTKTTIVDSQDVELELWDTSGDIQLHQLQLLSYLRWDAVFLCFSVNSPQQFDRTQTQWLREIRMNCHDAPVILLGLKTDLRVGSGSWAPLYNASLNSRVGATEANIAAYAHGAVKYMECSSKSGQGVATILEEGVRVVFDERAADEEAIRMNMQSPPPGVVGRVGSGIGRMFCFA